MIYEIEVMDMKRSGNRECLAMCFMGGLYPRMHGFACA